MFPGFWKIYEKPFSITRFVRALEAMAVIDVDARLRNKSNYTINASTKWWVYIILSPKIGPITFWQDPGQIIACHRYSVPDMNLQQPKQLPSTVSAVHRELSTGTAAGLAVSRERVVPF